MALYIGSSEKQKLILDGVVYRFNLFTSAPISNLVGLLSSDNYILKDSNGICLLPSDYASAKILSSDEYIIADSDGVYLTY